MKTIRTCQLLIVPSLLFFAVMLAAPKSSFAQCTNRISGRVTLDGSTPDARVDVHLLGPRGSDRTARTNNDGQYAFAKVCPGSYRVRPGPAFLENAMQPSRYTPSSQEVTIPSGNTIQSGNDGPVYVKGINFMRSNPPGQGGPSGVGNFIEDKIRIDESVRSGQDLKLAREIEQFLENTLPCKEHLCDLTIKVRNGHVAIAGVMQPNDKPLLNKVGEAIGGVRRLDISGVKSIEWTYRPGQQGPRDQGNFIKDHIRIDETTGSGSGDVRLARQIEQFLEETLPCKGHVCDLTIKVRNGQVAIAGVIDPFDRPALNRVGEAIGGVKRLDLSGVRSKEQP